MALISCKECGGKLSSKASFCPIVVVQVCTKKNWVFFIETKTEKIKAEDKVSSKKSFSSLEKFVFLISVSLITAVGIAFNFPIWTFLFQLTVIVVLIIVAFFIIRILGGGKNYSNNMYRRASVSKEQQGQSINEIADEVDDFDGGF